ncbi:DUF5079 family protein [Staphylococcus simulans]|uniref:DUF5079 family protein n=1 Tax=Staphylococcus simulans TaxID=1286 RepID=UPI003F7F6B33
MNAAYEKLRKPMPQIVGSATLIPLAMSGSQYFYGLTIYSTPLYLSITSLLMLLIIVSTFLICVFRKPKNHENMKRKALILLILNILAMYSFIFALYNVYFFLGSREGVDLFKFWIVGSLTMAICISAFIVGIILLHRTPNWLKGKELKDKVDSKIVVIIVAFAISLIVVVEKVIEFILIPNINESKFVILVIAGLILISYYNVSVMYIHYTQVLSDYELDDADAFFN